MCRIGLGQKEGSLSQQKERGWGIGYSYQMASGFSMKQELRILIGEVRDLRLADGKPKFGRAAV